MNLFLIIDDKENKEPIKMISPEEQYSQKLKNKFSSLCSLLENHENNENNEKNENNENFNKNIEPIFYNKKEFAEFMKDSNNCLEKTWRTRILFENTPRGNIIMYYDPYKLGFSYYCDQSVVSYDILNAAAMKYVEFYRCIDFFMDEKYKSSPFVKIHFSEEPKKKEIHIKEHNQSQLKEKSPFAKLKNYSLEKKPVENKDKNNDKENKLNEPVAEKQKELMKNKFVYLGKINNCKLLQSSPKKRKVLAKFSSPLLETLKTNSDNIQKECLSYKDFKKHFEHIKLDD